MILLSLNIITCSGIAVAIAWIIRQVAHSRGCLSVMFRLSLAMIAVPYALKVIERVHGDLPTTVDVIRDLGLLILFVTVIIFHRERFGKL